MSLLGVIHKERRLHELLCMWCHEALPWFVLMRLPARVSETTIRAEGEVLHVVNIPIINILYHIK